MITFRFTLKLQPFQVVSFYSVSRCMMQNSFISKLNGLKNQHALHRYEIVQHFSQNSRRRTLLAATDDVKRKILRDGVTLLG